MRLRKIPGAREVVAASPLVIAEADALARAGAWRQAFPKDGPLHLEIGMGRGRFLIASAACFPDINFLGLEMREEMIMQALDRLAGRPGNLLFLWLNAARLDQVFAAGEIDLIYMNFPDPWPKTRHAKRRLTAPALLRQYRQILCSGGELRFKTDNAALFHWSELNFRAEGWEIQDLDQNLPAERAVVMTEYENRYRRKGQPIYFLSARPPAESEKSAAD